MTYWPLRFLAKWIFEIFYKLKAYGRHNIPHKGPYIVCANHSSFLDPVVICAAIPHRVYWVALKTLYTIWPFAVFLRFAKCIRVNGVIKEALLAIEGGKVIGIFPEGRRTYDGKLMRKGKRGAALLALRTGALVLPAWIDGTYQAYPRRAKFPKVHPINICFGKVLEFQRHSEEVIDEEIITAAAAKIMKAISGLAPTPAPSEG